MGRERTTRPTAGLTEKERQIVGLLEANPIGLTLPEIVQRLWPDVTDEEQMTKKLIAARVHIHNIRTYGMMPIENRSTYILKRRNDQRKAS